MFGLGAGEILVIGVIALIFIGPKKLPELAKGLGRGIREFQKAKNDLMDEVRAEEIEEVQKEITANMEKESQKAHEHAEQEKEKNLQDQNSSSTQKQS